MQVLETPRLVLRWVTTDDAPFIHELLNEPSFIQFIGDKGVRTLDDARNYILTGPVASYQRFGFGLYLVLLKETGAPIGMCGLLKRDTLPDVDVGYALRPAFWLQGYAYEAALAVLAHGREAFGETRPALRGEHQPLPRPGYAPVRNRIVTQTMTIMTKRSCQ